MAILQMRKINVYALRKNRKNILEYLQRKGVVELSSVKADSEIFENTDTTSQQTLFLKNSASAKTAAEILDKYSPSKKSLLSALSGRKTLDSEDYYKFVDENEEIMRLVSAVNLAEKRISEKRAEIIKLQNQLDSLKPWQTLDIAMTFKGTSKTTAFIGTFAEDITQEQLLAQLAEKAPECSFDIEILSNTTEQTCVFILCHKKYTSRAESALRSLGFSSIASPTNDSPIERMDELEKEISSLNAEINNEVNFIKSNVGMRNAFKFYEDYYSMRADKYKAISKLATSKNTFILSGYLPEKDAPELEKELTEKFSAFVEITEAGDSKDVPTVLKNNSVSEPVESVLATYSMPQRSEIDPTTIMSVFYYILFGIMFSDAGYGLVMFGACFFALNKFKSMEQGLKRSVKMFMYCGISTIFWGLLFGSFFGDAVSAISKTFFDHEIILGAIWFNPVTNPMKMLMFSFVLGIIHLFAGLGILAYKHIRRGHAIYAVYDTLSWYLLIGGLIMLLLSQDMLVSMTGVKLPAVAGTVGAVLAGIGAVIILIFAGRESVNPVKRLLKGAYGLYGVTSYLSDILSYSRLLALGLATGVIGQVFNKIATLGGKSVGGVILFIIVFVIGHTLNIGINALGAYVHTNRLQFVEFFNKFYEGDGKKFEPFEIKTKYYNIKENV